MPSPAFSKQGAALNRHQRRAAKARRMKMQPMKEAVRRADGNDEVIKLLERWLSRAKEHGQIGGIVVVAAENL